MKENTGILLVNALDIYGGGEFFVLQLASEFKERGYSVFIACSVSGFLQKKCLDAGLQTIPLRFKKNHHINLFSSLKVLKNFLKGKKISIIHTNTDKDRMLGAIASKLFNLKHITTLHSLQSIQHNLTHYIRNKLITDFFTADGNSIYKLLIDKNKIDKEKIKIIHLGLDQDLYRRDEIKRNLFRKRYNINENHFVIGNLGRMVEFKGQEYLLRAFKNISIAHPDTRLIIAGSGELEYHLKKLSTDLQLDSRVIFPGFISDIQELYSAFDLYIQPSLNNGGELFPISILYAMAQKLPVIATNTGDISEMVTNNINGFLINEKDVSSINEAVSLFIKNNDLKIQMGNASYNLITENFTLHKMVNSFEALYKEINSKRGNNNLYFF